MNAFDYDRGAPRKATNLSINTDLLRIARQLGISLSRELEEIVAAHRRAAWLAENQEAIAAYNEHVERNGVFGDGLRSF